LALLKAPPHDGKEAWYYLALSEHIGVQEHRAMTLFGSKLIQSDRLRHEKKNAFQPSVVDP